MACVTLKRSLDFDPIHPSSNSCSPRPQKRRRCIPMCVSPQSALAASSATNIAQSPFYDATPMLTPEQIAQNVREEIRRLKRRKALQMGERSTMDIEGSGSFDDSPDSPPSSFSPPRSSQYQEGRFSPLSGHREKPLFTFKQVNLICEQVLRERESRLREEYDRVLSSKLAEQYDSFVKFTADHITHTLARRHPTYLS